MRRTTLAALILVSLFSTGFSYSYSAFSMMTGKNTFAVNPYVFGDGTGYVGQELFLAYGLTDKADIWSSLYIDNDGIVDFSAMLRYDLTGKNTILALRANGTYVSPQFHWIWENDKVALQANLSATFNYDAMDKPDIKSVLCPVVKIAGGLVDVFCEVNPGYSIGAESFGLDVVPGVGFAVGSTLFSIACPIMDITNDATLTFGAWWFFTITPPKE